MSNKNGSSSAVNVDIWMPLMVDKWITAVTTLDRADTGSYLQAILYHWKYGPLPADLEQVCRIMKIDIGHASSIALASPKHPFSIALALLKKYFVQNEDGTWTQTSNQRIKDEWTGRRRVYNERAKKAAAARWANHVKKGDASSIAQALLEECPVSIPLSTSTNTSPPSGPPQVGDEKAARNGATVEANGAEVEAKKEEKPTGPRRDRKGGGVGNGSKLAAARARTQGLQAKKTHPMLAKNPPKPPDPRKQPFKAEIFRWYADVNGRDPEHTPWGSPGDRALDAMLDATSIRIGDLQTCLKHRAQSIGAGEYSPSLMPGAWLRKLPSFLSLPLDRYGNPLSSKRKPLG